ncbi:hypothetical protein BZA05DRAFT_245603 [Tricharina praecox]|uniref:uncharacterized protein n=1 Tax=Tricharina praecox TaxID=43433 RepID=UPI00221E87E3|nr:uncharacterized protein BZA05DRAFT_245603 [Tricharina praecox]KAI5854592.1 hypothetical protein BZA05DRAFT_245603 [Tricharina praecox]
MGTVHPPSPSAVALPSTHCPEHPPRAPIPFRFPFDSLFDSQSGKLTTITSIIPQLPQLPRIILHYPPLSPLPISPIIPHFQLSQLSRSFPVFTAIPGSPHPPSRAHSPPFTPVPSPSPVLDMIPRDLSIRSSTSCAHPHLPSAPSLPIHPPPPRRPSHNG